MTDVAGILACYRSGQIDEPVMVEICNTWPEVRVALEATTPGAPKALEPVEAGGCAPPILAAPVVPPRQTLIAWASGRLDFIGDAPVPDGAIRIVTANGEDAVKFLFENVLEQAQLRDFGGAVALALPGIDWGYDGTDASEYVLDTLIDWSDMLREQIGPDAAFDWQRAAEATA